MTIFDPFSFPDKSPRPKQIQAFRLIDKNSDVLANLHTSYGKTWIALYFAQRMIHQKKRFIICCPLKAVVDQHQDSFEPYFNVLPVSGDYRHHKKELFQQDLDGYIMTYEMVYQLILKISIRDLFFSQIGGIVFDESHLIGTDRGPVLESMIYLLKHFFSGIQILYLSATTGNPEEFAEHFQTKIVKTEENERPVPLHTQIEPIPLAANKQEAFQIILFRISKIIDLYADSPQIPQILVFCQARFQTRELCRLFNVKYPKIRADYHHAGRSQKDRKQVESDFRGGLISIIFCTPTLTMGVNVPADIVIISSITRYNSLKHQQEIISANELLQMIGRAGRPGQHSVLYEMVDGQKVRYGQAIIYCEKQHYGIVQSMLKTPVILASRIDTCLKYIMCTWMCGGILNLPLLQNFYEHIFIPTPNVEKFQKEFTWLKEKHFLSQDQHGNLILKHNGEVVAHYAILPETVLYFIFMKNRLENWENKEELTHSVILMAFLSCPEFTQLIHVDSNSDGAILQNARFLLPSNMLFRVVEGTLNPHSTMKRLQKSFGMIFHQYLELRYWCFGHFPLNWVKIQNGDVRNLLNSSNRLLVAIRALFGVNWRFGRVIHELCQMMTCEPPICDADLLSLLLMHGVGLKSAILLKTAQIHNQKELNDANLNQLSTKIRRIVTKINNRIEDSRNSERGDDFQGKKKPTKWRTLGLKSLKKFQTNGTPKPTSSPAPTSTLKKFIEMPPV